MNNIAKIIQVISLAQAHASQPAANQTTWAMDDSTDKLVDNLFDRAHYLSHPQDADLDDTMLAKPGGTVPRASGTPGFHKQILRGLLATHAMFPNGASQHVMAQAIAAKKPVPRTSATEGIGLMPREQTTAQTVKRKQNVPFRSNAQGSSGYPRMKTKAQRKKARAQRKNEVTSRASEIPVVHKQIPLGQTVEAPASKVSAEELEAMHAVEAQLEAALQETKHAQWIADWREQITDKAEALLTPAQPAAGDAKADTKEEVRQWIANWRKSAGRAAAETKSSATAEGPASAPASPFAVTETMIQGVPVRILPGGEKEYMFDKASSMQPAP